MLLHMVLLLIGVINFQYMAYLYLSSIIFPHSSLLSLIPSDHFPVERDASPCPFTPILYHFFALSLPHSNERGNTVLKLFCLVLFTWHYSFHVHPFSFKCLVFVILLQLRVVFHYMYTPDFPLMGIQPLLTVPLPTLICIYHCSMII